MYRTVFLYVFCTFSIVFGQNTISPICETQKAKDCGFFAKTTQDLATMRETEAWMKPVADKVISGFCEKLEDCTDDELQCGKTNSSVINEVCKRPGSPKSPEKPLAISPNCQQVLKDSNRFQFVESLVKLADNKDVSKAFRCKYLSNTLLVENAHQDVLNLCGEPDDELLTEFLRSTREQYGCV